MTNLTSKERTTHWNMWDVLRNRAEDAHRAGNRGLAATLYQAAEELESSNLKTERMRTELQLQWERDESQRAEIERLARENEDFLDERQRRIHEILRLRAALDSLLTALNFRDSGERLFAVYGMPAIDAANAAAALLRDGCPPVETSGEHVHSDECWEPDSGCDMGRNDAHAVVEERCEHGIPRRFCTAVHPSENGSGERHG